MPGQITLNQILAKNQLTLKEMISLLMIFEIPRSNECVRQFGNGTFIQNIFNIDEDEKKYIALIVSQSDLDDLKFTDEMVREMERYTGMNDDCPHTLFSFYSEKIIYNSSIETVVELYRIGRELCLK